MADEPLASSTQAGKQVPFPAPGHKTACHDIRRQPPTSKAQRWPQCHPRLSDFDQADRLAVMAKGAEICAVAPVVARSSDRAGSLMAYPLLQEMEAPPLPFALCRRWRPGPAGTGLSGPLWSEDV